MLQGCCGGTRGDAGEDVEGGYCKDAAGDAAVGVLLERAFGGMLLQRGLWGCCTKGCGGMLLQRDAGRFPPIPTPFSPPSLEQPRGLPTLGEKVPTRAPRAFRALQLHTRGRGHRLLATAQNLGCLSPPWGA